MRTLESIISVFRIPLFEVRKFGFRVILAPNLTGLIPLTGDAGWCRESTISLEVKNSVYPLPRDMNFTSLCVWPSLTEKLRGSPRYATRARPATASGGLRADGTEAVALDSPSHLLRDDPTRISVETSRNNEGRDRILRAIAY